MLLTSVTVSPFRSINQKQTIEIDNEITVFVGMNESGKTVFLKALEKSSDALDLAKFEPIDDYPRKDLTSYLKRHADNPEEVVDLTYELLNEEVDELNSALHVGIPYGFSFGRQFKYDNSTTIRIKVDEKPVLDYLRKSAQLSSDASNALKGAKSLRDIPRALESISLTADDTEFLNAVKKRLEATKWTSVIEFEVYQWLKNRVPKFAYFGDYEILPSQVNLATLTKRVSQAETNPKILTSEDRGVLALLRMADIELEDFTSGGYEELKAKLEGISIQLTDEILEFWKQNEELEVVIDIKSDPEASPPFDNGTNLYLRIANRRHRGVTTPFKQRSRGFTWFFSFLVWFNDIREQLAQIGSTNRDLILLLDEPGLSLHAMAQADFLRYIDSLAEKHQVLYTTHSPFMVHSDRLHQVRIVEDQKKIGTVISANVSGSDPRTVFPLQAALGWTIAQNLFVSLRNLLVEGTSDMVYLDAMSSILSSHGKVCLREDIKIVPTGGLDKVVTFVALLNANKLKLAVLHDYRGKPEQKLLDLAKEKIIHTKFVLNVSQFRDVSKIGIDSEASDIEDLFPVPVYLEYFNKSFGKQLGGTVITESDLPPGPRIIERIDRFLESKSIRLRPSGGFNHYTVAAEFASHPPASVDSDTLKRFEELFKAVNALL